MKFIANPVEVEAFTILQVEEMEQETGSAEAPTLRLLIGDGVSENQHVVADPGMTARMKPTVGDYWVVQSDGYSYLNPKEVFERKYHAI